MESVIAATQWVVFVCGGHRFGLPLERTREILTPRPLTRLPGCGPEVCGMVATRGRVLTVFDFGMIAFGTSSRRQPDHRFLVLIVKGRRVALVVDQIVTISREEIAVEPLNGATGVPPGIDRDDFFGVGTLDDLSFLALDPDLVVGRLLT